MKVAVGLSLDDTTQPLVPPTSYSARQPLSWMTATVSPLLAARLIKRAEVEHMPCKMLSDVVSAVYCLMALCICCCAVCTPPNSQLICVQPTWKEIGAAKEQTMGRTLRVIV